MISPACDIKTIVSLRIQFQTGRTTHIMLPLDSHVLRVICLHPSHPVCTAYITLTQFTTNGTQVIPFRLVRTQFVHVIGILREINLLIRITYRVRQCPFQFQIVNNIITDMCLHINRASLGFIPGIIHFVQHVKIIHRNRATRPLIKITGAIGIKSRNGTTHIISIIQDA